MELTPQEIWSVVKEQSREHINNRSFETWVMPTRGVSMSDDILVVEADSKFAADYIGDRFRPVLEKHTCSVLGRKMLLSFTSSNKSNSSHNGRRESHAIIHELPPRRRNPNIHQINLNTKYTFDTFVVGSNNQLAHAASLAVSESPALRYNPLFIYGGTGLGKTHLMQAIGNSLLANGNIHNVFYGPAEVFMNELIQSIQQGTTSSFRNKYRNADILLIDDVQFLAHKEGTQEEFFHTFNVLYDKKKQIVLTSDRDPNDIPTLEERLVSRFAWGLVVDIQPPDFETRMAILRKKSETDNLELPDSVLEFIAEYVTSNVRDLESSLIRIVARSSLLNCETTVSLARDVLKDILSREAKKISVAKIQKLTAQNYHVPVEALKSKSRTKTVALARQVAIYLTRELTTMPLVEIGDSFGGRDHATVIHSCKKIKELIDRDEQIRKEIKTLTELAKQ